MLNGLSFAEPAFPSGLAGLPKFVAGDFNAANAGPEIVGGPSLGAGAANSDIQIADFNRDGKLDLSVSSGGTGVNNSEVAIYLGNGAGGFSHSQTVVPGRTIFCHAAGDFNGDGRPDLFLPTISTVGDPVAYLSTGVGNGTFNSPALSIYGAYVQDVLAADFNGDGKLDLATAGNAALGQTAGVAIWRGDGTGNLTLNQQIGAQSVLLTSGDLNGDGRIDLVSMGYYGDVSVILGKSDGTFADAKYFAGSTSGSSTALVVGDFDGDGKQDLAFTDSGPYSSSHGVIVMPGDGNGSLLEPVKFSLPSDPWGDLRAADFNNDGKLDLLAGTGNGIAVLINQSTPRNATTSTLVSSRNPAGFGQSVTLTATVTSAAGTPPGTVSFKQIFSGGEILMGTAPLTGNTANFTTSPLFVGNYNFRATYVGDTDFAGSMSDILAVTVNRADTTTTVAAAPNPVMIGQPVTFTATVGVASPGAGTPTGTVTFKEGDATLGAATLTGNTATFSTASLGVGSHSITAVYEGDANFAGSSGQQTLIVKPVNQAPVLTSATPMRTTRPKTPVVLSLASVINQGTGTTTIEDSDIGDPVGGVAVIGVAGQGTWAYSLDGATFHDISGPLTAGSAMLLPAGAAVRYTPDGINAEIATLAFRAWDTFSGGVADTGVDTTAHGGNTGFSTATDTIAVGVQRRVRRHAWVDFGEGSTFVFTGSSPEPQIVPYTDRSAAATEAYAYPGQVEILVSPRTPPVRVARFVQAHGGTVMTQVPSLGSYLVGVVPGREAAFTTVAYAENRVHLALPHEVVDFAASARLTALVTAGGAFPVTTQILTGAAAKTGPNTFDFIIDDNTNDVIQTSSGGWMTHQAAVTYAESSPDRLPNRNLGLADATSDPSAAYHLGMGLQIDATLFGKLSRVGNTLAMSIAVETLKANPDARAVINLSQQAYGGDDDDLNIRLGYARREQEFLGQIAQQLALLDADVLARTTVVVSAGNGYLDAGKNRQGVDLGVFLKGLHAQFKTVFPADGSHRMIVVGATREDGTTVHTGFNHALGTPLDEDGNPTMVYAPGVNVQVAADGTRAHGTSFAAPVVKAILERAQAARPGAKRDDVVRAFLAAVKQRLATHTLPNLQDIWNKLNPTLSIDTEMVTEGSGGGTTDTGLFVTLSHPSDQDITLTYEERDSSALAGRDYVKTGPRQITISAGETAKAIPLSVIADNLDERDRTFYVDIRDVSARSVNLASSTLSGWVTIIDDDAAPAIGVGNLQVIQPKSGSMVANLTVTLSAASGEAVTFQYYTQQGTAVPGQDYVHIPLSTVQTIPAGSTQTTVSVTILGELGPQPNQTFTVHLHNVSGATYQTTGFGTCTLVNDNTLGPYQLVVTQVVGSGRFGSRVWDDTGQIDTDQGKTIGTYSGPSQGSHWLQTSDAFSSIYNASTGQLITTGTLFFDSSTIPSGLAVRVVYPSYLQAASSADLVTPSPADVLTEAQLPPLVAAAIANWAAAGITAPALDAMKRAQFVVTDLPGASLGLAQASRIYLDQDAAGYGWFVDPTPTIDEEFSPPETSGQWTAIDPRALDRMDLLTVVEHELGHLAGLPDLATSTSDLMSHVLGTGTRRRSRQAATDEVLASSSIWN